MVVDPIKEKQNERVTLDDFIMCNRDTSMVVDPIKEKQNERVTLDDFIMCNGDTDYYTNGK